MSRRLLDIIFSFSQRPSCARQPTHWRILSCTGKVKLAKLLETVDFKLGRSNRQLLLLFDRPQWCNDLVSFSWLHGWLLDYLETSGAKVNNFMHFFWVLGFFDRSSTSFENQSRPKQSERKRLETSSILFHGQKLRSWTFDKSDLTWNGSVSASLISPSSFGFFGMQLQHQTSTHAGNILSIVGDNQ